MLYYQDKAVKLHLDAYAYMQSNGTKTGDLLKLIMDGKQCRILATDFAHKAAAFRHAKLNAIDLNANVVERYVIHAPQPCHSVEEWMKITGAQRAESEELLNRVIEGKVIKTATHDDYNEPGILN